MPEPASVVVIAALIAALEGMTGTRFWGTPYPNTITVSGDYLSLEQVNKFPHLIVIEAPASEFSVLTTAGGEVGMRHALRLLLLGYVRGEPGVVSRSTWLHRLLADCMRTILADAALGALCHRILFDAEREFDDGELAPKGAFSQRLTLEFDETFTVA